MDANDVTQVVDKVAEKLGVAVEQVAPVLEQVVREYQRMQISGLVGCVVMVIAALVVMRVLGAWCRAQMALPETDSEGWFTGFMVSGIVSGAVAFIFTCIGVFWYIPRALAPTFYCLKELLR